MCCLIISVGDFNILAFDTNDLSLHTPFGPNHCHLLGIGYLGFFGVPQARVFSYILTIFSEIILLIEDNRVLDDLAFAEAEVIIALFCYHSPGVQHQFAGIDGCKLP